MPLQGNTIITERYRTPENLSRKLDYSTCSYVSIVGGTYDWRCVPASTFVYDGNADGVFFYYKKEGLKNVPYIPSIHNQKPLAYKIVYINNFYPKVHLNGVMVQSDVVGGGLKCPPMPTNQKYVYSNSPGVAIPYLPVTQAMRNHAIADCNGEIGEQKSVTVNWANFIGESHDTRRMMAARLESLIKVVRYLRKAKYEKAYKELFGYEGVGYYDPNYKSWKYRGKRNRRKAGDLWLEWTYGWELLIQDVNYALHDLMKKPSPLVISARGHAVDQSTSEFRTNTVVSIASGVSVTLPYTLIVKKYTKYSVSVRYEVLNTIMSDLTGAGITDPVGLLWELTPFSFVGDWFVNVGDWLRNASIGNGLKYLSGTETIVQRMEAVNKNEWQFFQKVRPSYYTVSGYARVDHTLANSDVSRTVLNAPPVMKIAINHRIASIDRFVSGAALLQQLLEGLGRGRN